ncbi:hypothetical protein DB346_02470 [Verrucomicrobia bacterium LW23]|nr:hypothetical protein DB346_04185 [Verrucomicrobia bacterium LW23]PTY04314.1 hypothetical protein DB346_02470 [Verrucomicrobia bacterium LW23]
MPDPNAHNPKHDKLLGGNASASRGTPVVSRGGEARPGLFRRLCALWPWFLGAFGVMLVLLFFMHGMLLRMAITYGVNWVAEGQKWDIKYTLEGNPVYGVTFNDVDIVPREPGPVEKIKARHLAVQYSLIGLIFSGLPRFATNLEAKDVEVVLDLEFKDPHAKASDAPLMLPPIPIPGKIAITNVNFRGKQKAGDVVVKDLNLNVEDNVPGSLRLGFLQLPGVGQWDDLSAGIAWKDRVLTLSKLALPPRVLIEKLALDTREAELGRVKLSFLGNTFDGTTQFVAAVEPGEEDQKLSATVKVENVSLDAIRESIGSDTPVTGKIAAVNMEFTGLINDVKSWVVDMNARLSTVEMMVRSGRARVDRGEMLLRMEKGVVDIKGVTLDVNQATRFVAKGKIDVTGPIRYDLEARGGIDNLAVFEPLLSALGVRDRIAGRLTVDWQGLGEMDPKVGLPSMKNNGTCNLNVSDLVAGPAKVSAITVKGRYSPEEIVFPIVQLTSGDFDFNAAVNWRDKLLTIAPISLIQKVPVAKTLLSGSISAPFDRDHLADPAKLIGPNGQIASNLKAEGIDVRQIARSFELEVPVDATLDATVVTSGRLSQMLGAIRVRLSRIVADSSPGLEPAICVVEGDFKDNQFSLNAQVTQAQLPPVVLRMAMPVNIADTIATGKLSPEGQLGVNLAVSGQSTKVEGNATLHLVAPYDYEAKLKGGIANLGAFQPLLNAFGVTQVVAGKANVSVEGKGSFPQGGDLAHWGSTDISLEKIGFGEVKGVDVRLKGSYDPEKIFFPGMRVSGRDLSLSGDLAWQQKKLSVLNISLRHQKRELGFGEVEAPLDFAKLGTPADMLRAPNRISARVRTEPLDITTLATSVGLSLPGSGNVQATLDVDGSVESLEASMTLRAKNLKAKALSGIEPAAFGMDLRLRDKKLTLVAEGTQPRIPPLRIAGELPCDVEQILRDGSVDRNGPIKLEARFRLPDLKLAEQLVPEIVEAQGNVSVDVKVDGTINQPRLQGHAEANAPLVRFSNITLPLITNVRGRILFNEKKMDIEQCTGLIAGGPFRLTGGANFEDLVDPKLNFTFTASDLLLTRDDNMIVRSDANLTLAGPLNEANVTGSIALVKSRFQKEIDILPIGLPGRPAPQAPASTLPDIGVKIPPVNNWNLDVAITTKDPFRIISNRADGNVLIDLRVTGKGENPQVNGRVTLRQIEAALPFSQLRIPNGLILFSGGLNARLEIRGRSKVNDYDITVQIYGTVLDPKVLFFSTPPLPQEDIVSLIATGSTTSELMSGGNVIAGKATWLVFMKLYDKIFGPRKRSSDDDFINRISVTPTADSKGYGIRTTFKINDQILLLGDVGVDGNFKGGIKYLIRFR